MSRGQKYLMNASGEEISLCNIKPEDKKKHQTVEKIFERIMVLRKRIIAEKSKIDSLVENYNLYLASRHNEKVPPMHCTLTNFSSTKQVIIKKSDVLEFDEKVLYAISKIKKCLEKWGSDSHPNLALITSEIFKIERSGKINRNFLLSLFRYNIKDKEWLEAIELIKESINIASRKEYMIFRERKRPTDTWSTIKLNLSGVRGEI